MGSLVLSIGDQLQEQIRLLEQLLGSSSLNHRVDTSVECITTCLKQGLPLLVCGNGGSASDALHISGELVGFFLHKRHAFNVICLNANVSVLTAWSNDVDYKSVFARQVEAHGKPGGVLWGISTSGNSQNVIQAFKASRELGMKSIALTGEGGGKVGELCDVLIEVPSKVTPRVQELHLAVYHYICEQVEFHLSEVAV